MSKFHFVKSIILIFCIIFLNSHKSYAYKFGPWESGMSLSQAKTECFTHEYNCKQHSQSWDLDHNVKRVDLYYNKIFFRKNANITHYFTHESKQLFSTDVTWVLKEYADYKILSKQLAFFLEEKYGKPKKSKGYHHTIIYGKWDKRDNEYLTFQDSQQKITLSLCKDLKNISIYYKDKMLLMLNDKEATMSTFPKMSDIDQL